MRLTIALVVCAALASLSLFVDGSSAQQEKKQPEKKKKVKAPETPWQVPKLADGKIVVTDTSPDFLKAPADVVLRDGVVIAKTPPTVDFLYYPCQTYKAKIWSNWGDGLAAGGKYYSAIGDHDAPEGNAFVYEYDPGSKVLRLLVNLRDLLQLMMGWYTPGKIHSRLDMGSDGKVYFSTHRGSTTTTTAQFHYTGDWIVRVDPKAAKPEIVAHGPVKNHCIPCSVLDPDRMIFYGGTAPGTKEDGGIRLLAYDVKNKKVLYDGPNGPGRYIMFARSTGKIYFNPGNANATGDIVCFDPAKGGDPYPIKANLAMRSNTEETPQGIIYTVGTSPKEGEGSVIYAFNTKTETADELGPATVGKLQYITSIDADMKTGRYLYYCAGAHSGSERDGTPIVQYDVKTKTRKVICFLHPFYKDKYGGALVGSYSTAVDPAGDKLYVTWNVNRGVSRGPWDCCGMTVIHIPESERQP